jgi:hypothetical protein
VNNERQDYKIGTVGAACGRERVNALIGKGTWLMDFLYLNETEQCNVLKLLEVGMG